MGGGFLITGGLLVFGVPPLFAVGTGLSLVMGASLINTLRHRNLGNVDFKLGLLMIIGTVPALYAAQRVNQQLEAAGVAGPVIRYLYVVFLAALGIFILWDHWRTRRRADSSGESTTTERLARRLQSWRPPPQYIYVPGLGRTSTVVSLPVSGNRGDIGRPPGVVRLGGGVLCRDSGGRRRLHPDPGAYLLVGCADRRRHWHGPVPSDNHRFGGGLRLRFGRTGGPAYGGFDAGRRFHWLPIWGWRHPVRRTIQDPLSLWDSGAFRRRFRGARTGFASDTGSGRAALDGGDGSPIGGWREECACSWECCRSGPSRRRSS